MVYRLTARYSVKKIVFITCLVALIYIQALLEHLNIYLLWVKFAELYKEPSVLQNQNLKVVYRKSKSAADEAFSAATTPETVNNSLQHSTWKV